MKITTNKLPERLYINTKDIQVLTNRTARTARLLMQNLRHGLGKAKGDKISVKEFCAATGFSEDVVREIL